MPILSAGESHISLCNACSYEYIGGCLTLLVPVTIGVAISCLQTHLLSTVLQVCANIQLSIGLIIGIIGRWKCIWDSSYSVPITCGGLTLNNKCTPRTYIKSVAVRVSHSMETEFYFKASF